MTSRSIGSSLTLARSCGSLVDLAAAAEGAVFELPPFVLGSAA